VPSIQSRLPLARDLARPVVCAHTRRRELSSSFGAAAASPLPPSCWTTTAPPPEHRRRRLPAKTFTTAAAAAATTTAAPSPDPEIDAVVNADAIPRTQDLAVPSYTSATLPPPQPWSPPLISDADRAPDEFLRVTSLRPPPVWYPAWMRYRRRDANDVFWSDKLRRNTLEVPRFERRWTVFSSLWYLCMQWRFRGFPPQFRYLIYLAVRAVRQRLYEGHKRLVLWQCKFEAALALRAVERRERAAAEVEAAAAAPGPSPASSSSSSYKPSPYGPRPGAGFSRLMALRRLHWRNSPVAELLYLQNVAITGRVHQLPPRMLRRSRPTLFWLF
jgi:hypothetical protein